MKKTIGCLLLLLAAGAASAQPEEERFRKACSVVIDNSGDFENTKKQIGDNLQL